MFKDFKEFIAKGNIMDLAIGIIIGGAFQKIVSSLVNDIIMPCIYTLTVKVNFTNLKFTLGDISINYGTFITNIIDFFIIAIVIFLLVKYLNKLNNTLENIHKNDIEITIKGKKKILKKKCDTSPEAPTTKICPYCFSEINIKATKCPNCTSSLEIK